MDVSSDVEERPAEQENESGEVCLGGVQLRHGSWVGLVVDGNPSSECQAHARNDFIPYCFNGKEYSEHCWQFLAELG